MRCIICCEEKNIDMTKIVKELRYLDNIDFVDDDGFDFIIRKYSRGGSGTTMATKYSDYKAKCCGDCYKKIKRVETIELLLFSVGAIMAGYFMLIASGGSEGMSSNGLYLMPISLFLLLIPNFFAKRRVKINKDSTINYFKDNISVPMGEYRFSNTKVMLRTRNNEYWWLM